MSNKKGFTLIELLVVISVVAIMMAVSMPALSRTKRSGQTGACRNNLHQIGMMCFNYANDHDDIMPKAYIRHSQGNPDRSICIPINLNDVSPKSNKGGPWEDDPERMDDSRDGYWQKYGTPIEEMVKYGITEKAFLCPSERWRQRGWNYGEYVKPRKIFHMGPDLWPEVAGWRRFVMISYMFLSGSCDANIRKINAKVLNPWKEHSDNPSLTVLAADAVMARPPDKPEYTWSRQEIRINHVSPQDDGRPTFQNILKGDGSLTCKGRSYYEVSVREDYEFVESEYGAWCYSYSGGVGPWYYWEGIKPLELPR